MVITINGTPGSGKSSVAKKLSKKLNWPRYYGGGIRRLKAKSMRLTLAEFNKLGETDNFTDFEVDKYLKQVAKKHPNSVIESRTAWYFIPNSIKIYLDVDERIGAKRVFAELKKYNKRNEDKKLHTTQDVLISHKRRKLSDYKRYKKYYHFNLFDKKNYDFILDTTNLNKKQVFNEVYKYIRNRLKSVDKTL